MIAHKARSMTTTTNDNISNSSKRAHTTPFWIATFFAVLLLAAPMLAPSLANATSTSVRVSARILPWLNVTATPLISSYRVDAEAIQRGFIDLPNSLSIQLSTNMRSDIDLSLESFGPERIVVGNGINSGSDMIRIAPIASNTPITRAVDLRVILPQGIAQGDYPLQMNLSAMNI
jgi:hypothetical protein